MPGSPVALTAPTLVRRSRTPRRRVCWTWQVGSGPPWWAPWRQPGDERFAAWLAPLAESGEVAGPSRSRRAGVSACRPDPRRCRRRRCPGRRDGSRVPRTWRPCGHHGIALAVCRHPRAPAHRPRARYRVIAHTMPSRWQADAIAWSAAVPRLVRACLRDRRSRRIRALRRACPPRHGRRMPRREQAASSRWAAFRRDPTGPTRRRRCSASRWEMPSGPAPRRTARSSRRDA